MRKFKITGHDTTAAGSSFFLSLMGIHQDIQVKIEIDNSFLISEKLGGGAREFNVPKKWIHKFFDDCNISFQAKVIQELDQIFGDSDRPCTFQDTLEMKYLERCMMETLRMCPPVPLIARQVKEEVKLASGDYIVPAGATVVVATYLLHRSESIYPNPDKFDPDNFLPERQANRHYYAFVPFSAGPRSCVGRKYAMLKLKVILSTVLRQFRVLSDMKEEDFRLQGDIILKREEGFQIRLEPRKPQPKKAAAS
jgi:cytochrome P450 family 4